MDFADRLFALANGLPISEEPAQHLASDAPSAFEKFHEQIVLDHYLGKRYQPAVEEIPALEKIFAPRDYRDDGRAITPHPSGDLAKRFTPSTTTTEFLDDAVVRNRATEDGQGIRHFACILRPVPDNCREQGDYHHLSQSEIGGEKRISQHLSAFRQKSTKATSELPTTRPRIVGSAIVHIFRTIMTRTHDPHLWYETRAV
jgi:hypothetical protein